MRSRTTRAPDGPHLLAKFLQENKLTQADAARELEAPKAAVSLWLARKILPKTAYRRAIEKWTAGKVPLGSWENESERAVVERVRPFKQDDSKSSKAA